jgi:nucleotide-binding universal stress UspA family protein
VVRAKGSLLFNRVLVPLDGSLAAEQIVPYALALAKGMGAELRLLRVISMAPLAGYYLSGGIDWEGIEKLMLGEAQAYLEEVKPRLNLEGTQITTSVSEGLTASSIISESNSMEGTLVAMTTHARSGVSKGIIGSVTDDVLRNGDVPMLVVRSTDEDAEAIVPELDTIVLALDGSDLAETVLPHAVAVARALDLKFDLLTVLPADDPAFVNVSVSSEVRDNALDYLQSVEDKLAEQGISRVAQAILHGQAAGAVIDLTDNLPGAMIALTTHGRSGAERWLVGSVAERVIRHSKRPVLLVRAKA